MMLTWLPDVLRAAGLVVVEFDGWQTRTTRQSGLTVEGVVCHHTATGPNVSNTAVARLLANGRSDLRGPLAQLGLDRDGHFWMIAAGRCNHNGFGEWGNDSIGIEAFNDGRGEPWPDVQIDAYVLGCAAILRHLDLDVSRCLGHKETDPNRKIDPTFDMRPFRARVADLLEDDMPSLEDIEKLLDKKIDAAVSDIKRNADTLRDSLADLQRRVMGVVPMADNAEQHREDALTGQALRKLLGLPEVD